MFSNVKKQDYSVEKSLIIETSTIVNVKQPGHHGNDEN